MEKSKIKTGIFGGSFNPIHMGHLALANYLCEYNGLDEIWFLVSPHNPLKQQTDLWDDNLRLSRPSYTIHTLDALHKAYPNREFTLIIGADNWLLFPRWYKAEEILKNHHVMIYPRPNFTIDPTTLPPSVQLADTPLLEVSSTFIRQALAEGRDIRYFLHPAVYERLKK